MKKLILAFVLFPMFCLSQTLIQDVSFMSFMNEVKDTHKSTEISTNMSVYIENGFLCIKSDIDFSKYKIVKIHPKEDFTNGDTEVYEIIMDNETNYAYMANYKKSRVLLITNEEQTETTLIYDKKGAI